MAVLALPTRMDLGSYIFQSTLDGLVYEFYFQYNSRDGYWYMTIRDDAKVDIRAGIKIVTGVPLLRLVRDLRAPLGELIVVDTSSIGEDPSLDNLGDDYKLMYIEESSL